jgi:hypothetical protein
MDDAIYLRKEKGLLEMTEEPYEYETILQSNLAQYPRLLAGGQMSEEGIDRWALIGREKGVPDKQGGGDRWSADHLFVDQNKIPTIVEVKRGNNTEIRRQIVGQMLDYVAHASIYWDASTLRQRFKETCSDIGVSPEQVLTELTGDEETAGFWEAVEKNLRSKEIRLLFVADTIPSELKRVVEFLNEAMQEVEVLATEVVQYASEEETVFVPRLYGQTEEAKASSSESVSRSGSEYVETESDLYADLESKLNSGEISEPIYDTFRDLYTFSKELGDTINIGGAKNANFGLQVDAHQGGYSGSPSVFTANVNGKVKVWPAQMPINEDVPEESPVSWNPEEYSRFEERFNELDGVSGNAAPIEVFTQTDTLRQFETIVEGFVKHCRAKQE